MTDEQKDKADVTSSPPDTSNWTPNPSLNEIAEAPDPVNGEIRRFLAGSRGCEITGMTLTPDQETMLVNVQHPGEATAAIGTRTPGNPREVSNWPEFDQPAGLGSPRS